MAKIKTTPRIQVGAGFQKYQDNPTVIGSRTSTPKPAEIPNYVPHWDSAAER